MPGRSESFPGALADEPYPVVASYQKNLLYLDVYKNYFRVVARLPGALARKRPGIDVRYSFDQIVHLSAVVAVERPAGAGE
jgi:hypothetical protein